MLVSVIVPVYNIEKYLTRCLDSIINQTYKNLEIILVDDGSTDNSGVICDEYALKDKRIKVIHKNNAGLLAARQTGYKQASGEYISFVDSDDYIELNTYEKLTDVIKIHPVDIVCYQMDIINLDGSVGSFTPFMNELKEVGVKELLGLLIKNKLSNSYCDKFYKKDVLKLLGQEKEFSNSYYEDNMTTYKNLSFINKGILINDKLYHYIIRDNGITKTYTKKHVLDLFDIETKKFEYFKNNYKEYINDAYINYLQACLLALYLSKNIENIDNERTQIINTSKVITKELKIIKLPTKINISVKLVKINYKLYFAFKDLYNLKYRLMKR